MRACGGIHCDGCRRGSPAIGIGAVVILTGVLVYAAHRRAIDHAVSEAAQIALISAVAAIGLVLVTAAIAITVRVRRHRSLKALRAQPRLYAVAQPVRGAIKDRPADLSVQAAAPHIRILPERTPAQRAAIESTSRPRRRTWTRGGGHDHAA